MPPGIADAAIKNQENANNSPTYYCAAINKNTSIVKIWGLSHYSPAPTFLYDEYIDRPELTEQKKTVEYIVPTPTLQKVRIKILQFFIISTKNFF